MKVTIQVPVQTCVKVSQMVVGNCYRAITSGKICFAARDHNSNTDTFYVVYLDHGGVPAIYEKMCVAGVFEDLGPLELCIADYVE